MSSGRIQIRASRRSGFTLLEAMVSLAIFAVLIVSLLSMVVDTYAFASTQDVQYSVQTEGNRAFLRLAELIRESGWVTDGGILYPRVVSGGAEMEFRALTDADRNGYPFDEVTRALEWHPRVFTIRLDGATGTLGVYDGAKLVWILGRHIRSVSFATYLEDAALSHKEIGVSILTQQLDRSGDVASFLASGSVSMRN